MKRATKCPLAMAAAGMLIIIFDGKTAASGVNSGIQMCLQTLIPSLFPFFILSSLVTGSLMGQSMAAFRGICRVCRMPAGSESLLIVGLLGGYPVGAGNIAAEFRRGNLTVTDAQRMAVFCNNAGPSFLFGILGPLFPNAAYLWTLWGIQIAAAILTGFLLPGTHAQPITVHRQPASLPDALNRSIKNMVLVCGWVILFRMILEYLHRYIFRYTPETLNVLLTGLLELSNGCLALSHISCDVLRFFLAGFMLSLGGSCVWMQTKAVFPELGLFRYIKGRVVHCMICLLFSFLAVPLLSEGPSGFLLPAVPIVGIILIFTKLLLRKQKKEVAFCGRMMYNGL